MFRLKYRYLFILLLSVYSFLNILFTSGDQVVGVQLPYGTLFAVITLIVLAIWEVNRFFESFLSRINEFLNKAIHPLIILFGLSCFGVFGISNGILFLLSKFTHPDINWNQENLLLLLTFGFRVNLFLNSVNGIWFYMSRLRQTEIEAAQLKKENLEAQFEALRSQINPHFLFNCLNALSTLVYRDAEVSAKFIAQLSNVYRYLLYNQEKKLVTLHDEMAFLESYLFLLKIRFGENIEIRKEIAEKYEHYHVPPAALQMLIENAIKHNVVSSRNPLRIDILCINGFVEVTNNLQEKTIKEESTHIGLENIRKRYEFLTDKKITISRTETDFRVSIPLINLEQ
ncbi:MAG: sensor histidine kinase [Cyclobacteriaceae bacterium]